MSGSFFNRFEKEKKKNYQLRRNMIEDLQSFTEKTPLPCPKKKRKVKNKRIEKKEKREIKWFKVDKSYVCT